MKISAGPLSPFNQFFDMITRAIEFHEQQHQRHSQAKNSHKILLKILSAVTDFDGGKSDPSKYMSEQELKAQLAMFFLSGYETTGISMNFMAIILSQHQHVQDKLIEEVNSFEDDQITYDTLMYEMPYLDCVLKELLRLYPVAINAVNRVVNGDNIDISGYTIDKQVSKVLINVWAIHRSTEIWGENANEFYPERFLECDERKSSSNYLAFGLGPHSCLGKIMSLFEIKFVIASILRRFRILPKDENEIFNEIPVNVGIVLTPKNPVKLRFIPHRSK